MGAGANQHTPAVLDGNGNASEWPYRAITGTVTLGTGTSLDDVTLPKGAKGISFWATVAFGFLGVGAAAGTEVTCLANYVYDVGCMGTDGTWKAFFDRSVTTPGTVNYIIHMGGV